MSDAPFFSVGNGEPLVVLPGLARGPQRSAASFRPLSIATGREIFLFNRPAGLARGISMRELAARQEEMIRARFDSPVDLMGASTGGAIALQLAVDHRQVIRRLIVVAAASWLGTAGREKLAAYGRSVEGGHSGAHILASVLAPPALELPTRAIIGLASWFERHVDPADMLATIDAECGFDVTPQLQSIGVPTLVIAGALDRAFPRDLVEATARGIPNAKLILYPGAGHMGAMFHRSFGPDVRTFLNDSAV